MKRIVIVMMMLALGFAVADGIAAQNATLQGTATNAGGAALPNVKVQLRNVDTGALIDAKTTDASGAYLFNIGNAGNYIVEIVDAAGKIIGASTSISVAAGAAITGVTVAASAAGAVAAAAAAGGLGAFFSSTGGILLLAGAAAAVGGGIYVATKEDASPSR